MVGAVVLVVAMTDDRVMNGLFKADKLPCGCCGKPKSEKEYLLRWQYY
jgi:hypothetical protein